MSIRTNSPSFDRYLLEIYSKPLYTREEEAQRAIRCQAGDKEAEKQLAEANLRFVVSVARMFSWSEVSLEDLVSTGNLGLLKAIKKYEPNLGARLISYAVWYIRRNIYEEIAKFQHIITSTRGHQSELATIRRALEAAIAGQNDKPLTPDKLEELGISESQIAQAKEPSTHQSLDAPFEGSDASLHDLLKNESGASPDAFVNNEHHQKIIHSLLDGLTTEETAVIRFICRLEDGQPHTIQEAAGRLGLPRHTVSARYALAMRKMQNAAKIIKSKEGSTFFDD